MLRNSCAAIAAFALLLVGVAAQPSGAQTRSDRAVYFTFSQPVALPGHTLPAGKYLFRLLDSQVNRNVVEVFNADGTQLQAMLMTIPAERLDRPDDAEVRFIESSAGSPAPIRTWWYPGERRGWEFIYPRTQAMQLAKTTHEPILTTASETPLDRMSDAPLARVGQNGDQAAVDANAAPAAAAPAGTALRGTPSATASTAAPRSDNVSPSPAPAAAAPASDRDALPRTASPLPAVLLLGVLAMAGAWLLRRVRLTA